MNEVGGARSELGLHPRGCGGRRTKDPVEWDIEGFGFSDSLASGWEVLKGRAGTGPTASSAGPIKQVGV